MWEPWHGCHRVSEGCQYCYIHKGDLKRGVDTAQIQLTGKLEAPVAKKKDGGYRMAGGMVYLCFGTDFLLPEADPWRLECWAIMKERADCRFLFLTKRIERLEAVLPADWGDGYENVTVGCTVENQRRADERLPILQALPLRHRNIICQPMLEAIDLEPYLKGVELVVAGGESDRDARPFDFDWALSLRAQCVRQGAAFQFRQCGTHFIKDGQAYTLPVRSLCAQAKKAAIDWSPDKPKA